MSLGAHSSAVRVQRRSNLSWNESSRAGAEVASWPLVLALLRTGLARDAAAFQRALVQWLKYYRKEEFPKVKVTKKITIKGTFFIHWAEKEGIPLTVPPEFADHIVRVPLNSAVYL